MNKSTTESEQVNFQPCELNSSLRVAWANLLDWYWWTSCVSLTWRTLPKTYTAINQAKRWVRAIEQGEKRNIGYYLCLEYTKVENRPHMHLLMGNMEGISYAKWGQIWYTKYGYARVKLYEKGRGTGYYLTKYIVKDVYHRASFEIKGLVHVNELRIKEVDKEVDNEK